jgi:hypothetical protein
LNNIATELGKFRELIAACEGAITSIQNDIVGAVGDIGNIYKDYQSKKVQLEEKEKDLKAAKESLAAMEKEGYSATDSSY